MQARAMSSTQSSSPNPQIEKQIESGPRRRLACDRCHSKKLRCLRTTSPNGHDCDRCLRMSAECVYSPPCRIGRPSRDRRRLSKLQMRTPSDTALQGSHILVVEPPQLVTGQESPQTEKDANFTHDFTFLENVDDPPLLHSTMIHGVAPESLSEVFSGVPDTKEFTPEDFIFDRDPEDFAEQLTSLSLLLHRQLNTVERRRKDTSLLSRLQEFPLESIFESTQKLVSIVEEVAGNPIWLARFDSSPEETGQPMLCTPSELSIDHFENISTINSTQSLPLSHCTSTLPVNSDHPDPPSMDSSPCVNSSRVSSFDSATRSSNVDILVVLMFLTCHVYLSRLYESFHCDLEQYSLLPPQASTRRVFWHLNLGSFCAIEGLGLEVALVAQVSSLMLERLQQAHKSCTEAGLITPELIKAVEMQDVINGI